MSSCRPRFRSSLLAPVAGMQGFSSQHQTVSRRNWRAALAPP